MGHLDKKMSNCLSHSLSYFITFTSLSSFDALNAKLQSVKHIAFFFWDTRYFFQFIYEVRKSREYVIITAPRGGEKKNFISRGAKNSYEKWISVVRQ